MERPIILTLCLMGFAAGAWHWQNPRPTGNDLTELWFAGADTGYATDGIGTLLRTTDGGEHWDTLPHMAAGFLQFPGDATTGFTVHKDCVYRTTDAGWTWHQVLWVRNACFSCLDFPAGPDTGYVAGASWDHVGILKTTNRGESWTVCLDTFMQSYPIWDIDFAPDCQTGYVTSRAGSMSGSVLKTTNGGRDWDWIVRNAAGDRTWLSFPRNADTGYVASNQRLFKTTNAGQTWDTLPLVVPIGIHHILFPFSPDTGYVLGTDYTARKLYRTTDGGNSWDTLMVPGYPGRLHFPTDNRVGHLVGASGLLGKSTDFGATWTRKEYRVVSENATLLDVKFPVDCRTGFACGQRGVFLKTTNGGRDWVQTGITDTLCGFYALDFPVDEQTGYLAGYVRPRAAILKTTDGGASWDTVLTDGTANSWFNDIQFPRGLDTGYAVQYPNRVVWRTTDGGDSWTRSYPVSRSYLTALDFPIDATNGYVVGYSGSVARTTDAGLHWEDVSTDYLHDSYAVQFPTGLDTGWIAGSSLGGVYRTTDRGATWEWQGNAYNGEFTAIEFPVDSRTGYFAGDNPGLLEVTTDAGEHWQGFPTCCQRQLNALCFPAGLDTGWAVGSGGVIISTCDGVGGIAETPNAEVRTANRAATIIRGVLNLEVGSRQHSSYSTELLDATGRKVLDLAPGPNDVSHLAPGVYFVRQEARTQSRAVQKVILTE